MKPCCEYDIYNVLNWRRREKKGVGGELWSLHVPVFQPIPYCSGSAVTWPYGEASPSILLSSSTSWSPASIPSERMMIGVNVSLVNLSVCLCLSLSLWSVSVSLVSVSLVCVYLSGRNCLAACVSFKDVARGEIWPLCFCAELWYIDVFDFGAVVFPCEQNTYMAISAWA